MVDTLVSLEKVVFKTTRLFPARDKHARTQDMKVVFPPHQMALNEIRRGNETAGKRRLFELEDSKYVGNNPMISIFTQSIVVQSLVGGCWSPVGNAAQARCLGCCSPIWTRALDFALANAQFAAPNRPLFVLEMSFPMSTLPARLSKGVQVCLLL